MNKMKKKKLTLFISILLILCFIGISGYATVFSDVGDDHWAAPYISSLEARGIISGYGDGTFLPDKYVDRSEYAKMLVNVSGLKLSSNRTSPYADVDVNEWYFPYINSITAQMTGYQSTTEGDERIYFKPLDYATREDVTVALMRVLNYDLSEYYPVSDYLLSDVFYDYESIPKQDRPYIAEAVKRGYITGTQMGTFEGSTPITRCEVCAVLCRAFPEGNTAYISIEDTGIEDTGIKDTSFEDYSIEDTEQVQEPDILLSGISDLKIYYLDVGQGDSEFIILPNGETMLIDAGTSSYGGKVSSFIGSLGYSKINYLVATHPHADHIGGMSDVLDTFEIGTAYMPNAVTTTKTYESFLSKLIEKQINTIQTVAGLTIIDDGYFSVRLLAPNSSEYKDLNNYSAVIKITYGNSGFIFMGDAQEQSENEILSAFDDSALLSNIIKIGHHGSSTSSQIEFLQRVNPQYAIISCGADNSYGHPTEQTLQRLESLGITVLRTDIDGDIGFGCNGSEIYRLEIQ